MDVNQNNTAYIDTKDALQSGVCIPNHGELDGKVLLMMAFRLGSGEPCMLLFDKDAVEQLEIEIAHYNKRYKEEKVT